MPATSSLARTSRPWQRAPTSTRHGPVGVIFTSMCDGPCAISRTQARRARSHDDGYFFAATSAHPYDMTHVIGALLRLLPRARRARSRDDGSFLVIKERASLRHGGRHANMSSFIASSASSTVWAYAMSAAASGAWSSSSSCPWSTKPAPFVGRRSYFHSASGRLLPSG